MNETAKPDRRRRLSAHELTMRRDRVFARTLEGQCYPKFAAVEGITPAAGARPRPTPIGSIWSGPRSPRPVLFRLELPAFQRLAAVAFACRLAVDGLLPKYLSAARQKWL